MEAAIARWPSWLCQGSKGMVKWLATCSHSIQVRQGIHLACHFYLSLFYLGWHHPCESRSSRTFRDNCIRPVEFALLCSQLMKGKTMIWRFACRWYIFPTHSTCWCHLHCAGTMWKVWWEMERAFSGSAQIGRMQYFGKNGNNLALSASHKVSSMSLAISLFSYGLQSLLHHLHCRNTHRPKQRSLFPKIILDGH